MDGNIKDRMMKALEQSKLGIRSVREALENIQDSEKARGRLYQADFDIIRGIHEISWIGKEKERFPDIDDDNDQLVEDDNPSR